MLSGQLVSLRPFDRLHLEQTRVWANDMELACFLDRSRPVSDAEHERWYAALLERTDCTLFALVRNEDERHVGNAWLWDIDARHRKAEVRIVIGDRSALGVGVGSQAISLLSTYAFERLNLHKVYAYVLDTNPRAVRAFSKVGFQTEGVLKNDRWVGSHYSDVYLLARMRGEEPLAPHAEEVPSRAGSSYRQPSRRRLSSPLQPAV